MLRIYTILFILKLLLVSFTTAQDVHISLPQTDSGFAFNVTSDRLRFILPIPQDAGGTREVEFSVVSLNGTINTYITDLQHCSLGSCHRSSYLLLDTTTAPEKRLYLPYYELPSQTIYLSVISSQIRDLQIRIQSYNRAAVSSPTIQSLLNQTWSDSWSVENNNFQSYSLYVPIAQERNYHLSVKLKIDSGNANLRIATSPNCAHTSCASSSYICSQTSPSLEKICDIPRWMMTSRTYFISLQGTTSQKASYTLYASLTERKEREVFTVTTSQWSLSDTWSTQRTVVYEVMLPSFSNLYIQVGLFQNPSLSLSLITTESCAYRETPCTSGSSVIDRDSTSASIKMIPQSALTSRGPCMRSISGGNMLYVTVHNRDTVMVTYNLNIHISTHQSYANCSGIPTPNPNPSPSPSPSPGISTGPTDIRSRLGGAASFLTVAMFASFYGLFLLICLFGYIYSRLRASSYSQKGLPVPFYLQMIQIITLLVLILTFVVTVVGLLCVIIIGYSLLQPSNPRKIVVYRY